MEADSYRGAHRGFAYAVWRALDDTWTAYAFQWHGCCVRGAATELLAEAAIIAAIDRKLGPEMVLVTVELTREEAHSLQDPLWSAWASAQRKFREAAHAALGEE